MYKRDYFLFSFVLQFFNFIAGDQKHFLPVSNQTFCGRNGDPITSESTVKIADDVNGGGSLIAYVTTP